MGHHSDDDDTYDPDQADSDIRAKVEKWNKPYEAPEKPAEQVYCRGKVANGRHDFSVLVNGGIGKIKHGYVDGDKVFGFARKRRVSYWEYIHECSKCGARYISRTGCEITRVAGGGPAHKASGRALTYTFHTGEYDPLPPGVEAYEWLG